MSEPIFHLVPADEWARTADRYVPSSLATEGFVHCSSRPQLARVAEALFAGRDDLVLLEIDPDRLPADVVWEDLYELGEDFPHVYGAIPRTAVNRATAFRRDDLATDDASPTSKLVICDLGSVVIRIDHTRILDAWAARSPLPPGQVHAGFPDDAYHAFERGELTEAVYLAHVRRRFSLNATDDELTEDLDRIFLGPNPATIAVLRDLRAAGRTVVALSNTNPIHERSWSRRYADHLDVFDDIHCSHVLGVRKPDPAAYTRVLALHDTAPRDALFIDDLAGNVEAARSLGLRGIVFEDAAQLAADVADLATAAHLQPPSVSDSSPRSST